MNDANYIPNYFIAEAEITPQLLTIIFNKDLPASFLNENDERPVVRIEITSPDFSGPIEALQERLDPHDDGIIFTILEEKIGGKTFQTTDMGGRTFTIKGADIQRQDLPYSN